MSPCPSLFFLFKTPLHNSQVVTIVVAELCGRYNRRLQPRAVPLVITTTVVFSGSYLIRKVACLCVAGQSYAFCSRMCLHSLFLESHRLADYSARLAVFLCAGSIWVAHRWSCCLVVKRNSLCACSICCQARRCTPRTAPRHNVTLKLGLLWVAVRHFACIHSLGA